MKCADIFKFDSNYLENEEKYKERKMNLLQNIIRQRSGLDAMYLSYNSSAKTEEEKEKEQLPIKSIRKNHWIKLGFGI